VNGNGENQNDWVEIRAGRAFKRGYSAEECTACAHVQIEHTLARRGAEKLWKMCNERPFVNSLGALTGNQAMQQVKAACGHLPLRVASGGRRERQPVHVSRPSLYAVTSVPSVVKRINNALQRADQLHHAEGENHVDWFAPIVADAEAGFGGVLNAHELMKSMIEAGAPGVHFEDQLARSRNAATGRQGAGADAGSGAEARRGASAADSWRAYRVAGAHRRRAAISSLRHRRDDKPFPPGSAPARASTA